MNKKTSLDYRIDRMLKTPDLSGEFHPIPKSYKEKKEAKPLGAGKRTVAWNDGREKLKELFKEHGIISCEVLLADCTGSYHWSFAHLKRRVNYSAEDLRNADPHTVVFACQTCHDILDNRMSKEDSERVMQSIVKARGW